MSEVKEICSSWWINLRTISKITIAVGGKEAINYHYHRCVPAVSIRWKRDSNNIRPIRNGQVAFGVWIRAMCGVKRRNPFIWEVRSTSTGQTLQCIGIGFQPILRCFDAKLWTCFSETDIGRSGEWCIGNGGLPPGQAHTQFGKHSRSGHESH